MIYTLPMKYFFFILITCIPLLSIDAQECSAEQNTLIVKITTDRFGRETSWVLSDIDSIYSEVKREEYTGATVDTCLLYTSPSPRDATLSRMPSSA